MGLLDKLFGKMPTFTTSAPESPTQTPAEMPPLSFRKTQLEAVSREELEAVIREQLESRSIPQSQLIPYWEKTLDPVTMMTLMVSSTGLVGKPLEELREIRDAFSAALKQATQTVRIAQIQAMPDSPEKKRLLQEIIAEIQSDS